jgi:hypothetical protein
VKKFDPLPTDINLLSPPTAIPKEDVWSFAEMIESEGPMIFWETVTMWDWMELSGGDPETPDKELLLHNLARLHDHFTDESIEDNERSMAVILKVTLPTENEKRRLQQKYGYDESPWGDHQ